MRNCLGLAVSVAVVAQLGACASVGHPAPEVFLLTGQSNMSGRGLVSDLTTEERTPDPAIQLYGNDGVLRVAEEPLDSAQGQIDTVSSDTQAAVGPGLFFARALRRVRGAPIVLVPCAKGGSSIRRWAPSEGRDSLYGSCLARARETAGRVTGIVWYQGETDAEKPDAAEPWKADFRKTMTQLRGDLGDARIPIVLVQLADNPLGGEGERPYPSWNAIQQAQAEDLVPCAAMISAKGLPLKADGLHLTTASQRVLGAKLAAAMDRMLNQGCQAATPAAPVAEVKQEI